MTNKQKRQRDLEKEYWRGYLNGEIDGSNGELFESNPFDITFPIDINNHFAVGYWNGWMEQISKLHNIEPKNLIPFEFKFHKMKITDVINRLRNYKHDDLYITNSLIKDFNFSNSEIQDAFSKLGKK